MSRHKVEHPTGAGAEPVAREQHATPAGSTEAAQAESPEPLPVPVAPHPLSPAEIEDLKSRAGQAQQWYDQLLRTTADLENFKKRSARERNDTMRFANESLLQKLVTVLDNFDMANAAASSGPNTTVQALQAGIAMIQQQLKAVLADAGLEEIDATGKPFDPNLHEAVSHEEAAGTAEGLVLRQLRKGYKLRERLLRPATVVVAKQANPQEAQTDDHA
ncbi:MAG: nucleotide exchange factor GrpE [Verrucomicrobia bacterium]|nr:nucleotide exchange factor GrpE [Verrucomicrobiota bacterium]